VTTGIERFNVKRLLLIVLAVLSVAAQETTLPQDHY